MGDLNGVPGSWLCPDPYFTIVAFWGVMGDPPLPSVFIVLPSKYTFKYMYIYSVFVEGIEKKKKKTVLPRCCVT